ncbi:MAG: sigma-70 family RNA polymerase sigma factor [Alphaproteobacteria bacterium]|nr:sigma-70 family RNA polymerase sigma factor [Alphaproteobacteria bacterium]
MSFEQTVLPHLDAAYNLARWLVRDPALAEDVVQDAALRALGYFRSYRGGSARAWFLQIVRNAALTRLAERQASAAREVRLDGATEDAVLAVADPAEGPEAALGMRQDAAALDQALAALPQDLRECLVLRELEELSYKEIARIVGVPVGTVMSRLWRARQVLMRTRETVTHDT